MSKWPLALALCQLLDPFCATLEFASQYSHELQVNT